VGNQEGKRKKGRGEIETEQLGENCRQTAFDQGEEEVSHRGKETETTRKGRRGRSTSQSRRRSASFSGKNLVQVISKEGRILGKKGSSSWETRKGTSGGAHNSSGTTDLESMTKRVTYVEDSHGRGNHCLERWNKSRFLRGIVKASKRTSRRRILHCLIK